MLASERKRKREKKKQEVLKRKCFIPVRKSVHRKRGKKRKEIIK